MQKTRIEWVRNPDGTQGYSWNVIKGWCPNDCPYCYSHRMYNRFGWDKTIRLDAKELNVKFPMNSRIFVGSMIDIYHPDINPEWVKIIIEYSKWCPFSTFITLTKFPENLYKFDFPFNWWVGVTIDSNKQKYFSVELFLNDNIVGKKFISFEPLLTHIDKFSLIGIDWIIIGGLTPKPKHKTYWIDDIVKCADDLGIPVFIKKNAKYDIVREEFPE